MSAFTIAFQVPNLIRSLFADAALQAAFVPVFTEQLEHRGRREAFRVASALVFVISVSLGVLSALFVLLAPVIMPLFAPGFDDQLTDLTVNLAQLMFPIVLMLGLSGLVVGVLNSFEHFAVPAIAPLFWNLVIIATLVALTPSFEGDDRIYAYAIGILLGTLVQLLLPLPWLRRTGFRLAREFDWRDERVMRVLKLMLPVTLGIGLINFNLSVNSIFATLISEEAPAAIDKAFRIYMLPQGVFAVALATVLFPTFSRLAARRDLDALRAVQGSGSRQMLLLLVPCAALMLVLSEPIADRLPARRVRRGADGHRGRGALLLRAVAAVRRGEPDHDPDLLQPPAAVAPDSDRAREPGGERGARRDPLQADGRGRDHARDRDRVVGDLRRAGDHPAHPIGGVDMARTVHAGMRITAPAWRVRPSPWACARRSAASATASASRRCSWWWPRGRASPPTPRSCWPRGSRRPARSSPLVRQQLARLRG